MTEDAWDLRELKVKSPPPPRLPPSPSLARAWGECFHWPMGLKHWKNLTWQTKGRHDECTASPRARLTDSTTLLQHPPPLGIDMEVPSQPMASRLRDWAWQWDQPEQQAPCVFSHRSDQKPGYRQVLVRIFWSVLRLDISVSKFWRFWMAVSCSI